MLIKSAWHWGEPHVLLFARRPYLAPHTIPVSPCKQTWAISPAKSWIWSAMIPWTPKTGPSTACSIETLGTTGRNVVPASMTLNKAVCLLPHSPNWLQISFAGRCNWSRRSSSSMIVLTSCLQGAEKMIVASQAVLHASMTACLPTPIRLCEIPTNVMHIWHWTPLPKEKSVSSDNILSVLGWVDCVATLGQLADVGQVTTSGIGQL